LINYKKLNIIILSEALSNKHLFEYIAILKNVPIFLYNSNIGQDRRDYDIF